MTAQYKNGDQIEVRHVCSPNCCSRFVTYEDDGIRVNQHWFRWSHFFEVNFIVTDENRVA